MADSEDIPMDGCTEMRQTSLLVEPRRRQCLYDDTGADCDGELARLISGELARQIYAGLASLLLDALK